MHVDCWKIYLQELTHMQCMRVKCCNGELSGLCFKNLSKLKRVFNFCSGKYLRRMFACKVIDVYLTKRKIVPKILRLARKISDCHTSALCFAQVKDPLRPSPLNLVHAPNINKCTRVFWICASLQVVHALEFAVCFVIFSCQSWIAEIRRSRHFLIICVADAVQCARRIAWCANTQSACTVHT